MYKNTCKSCGCKFQSKTKGGKNGKNYCSEKCRQDSFVRFDQWLDYEILELERLSKLMPKKQISHEFLRISKLKGWRNRSYTAVRTKLYLMELDHSPTLEREWYTAYELADVLNIHYARPNKKWRENGLDWSFYMGWRTCTFHIKDVKKYAAKRPRDFYGIPVGKLNIIFKDLAFSKEIFELAFSDSFSNCFCIVRLQGGVFKSAGDCADKLVLGQSTVENNVKSESSINVRGTHDLVKLNYPIYLAPFGYEDEFNELAGNILIQLYAEYKNIEGYSKLGIQVISVRQAVQIALMSFRAFFRNKSLSIAEKSKEAIANFWKDKYIKIYLWHFQICNYNSSRNRIHRNLKVRCGGLFSSIYKNQSEQYFKEFCDYFISKFTESYFCDQFLPKKLMQNKYIYCDIWLFVECMSLVVIKKQKNLALAKAFAYTFIKKNQPSSNYNPDWLEHNIHTEESSFSQIEVILQGLDELNLEDSYKLLCNKYIQGFLRLGDASTIKKHLGINDETEAEILKTLKLATVPF